VRVGGIVGAEMFRVAREAMMAQHRRRSVLPVVMASCVVFGLAGCGGASRPTASLPQLEERQNPAGEVVRVAEAGGIGQKALAHWIAVQAATTYSSRPSRPVPAGVVPDPPLYRQCISQLRAEPVALNPHNAKKPKPKPTDANLKKECEAKYEALRQHVLLILTSFQWLAGESARDGIKISDTTVRRELERFRKGQFATAPAFEAYLRNTGQTYQDELLRMRMDLYSNELARIAGAKVHAASQQAIYEAYLRATGATSRRWAAKTTCAPGYVTQNCSNYKGRLEPELRI
jgi:hypothetical protein